MGNLLPEIVAIAAVLFLVVFVFLPRLQGRGRAYAKQQEQLELHQLFMGITKNEPMVHATVGDLYMTEDPNLLNQPELVKDRGFMPMLLAYANDQLFVVDIEGEVLYQRAMAGVKLEIFDGYMVFELGSQLYLFARDQAPLGAPLNDSTFMHGLTMEQDAYWARFLEVK